MRAYRQKMKSCKWGSRRGTTTVMCLEAPREHLPRGMSMVCTMNTTSRRLHWIFGLIAFCLLKDKRLMSPSTICVLPLSLYLRVLFAVGLSITTFHNAFAGVILNHADTYLFIATREQTILDQK